MGMGSGRRRFYFVTDSIITWQQFKKINKPRLLAIKKPPDNPGGLFIANVSYSTSVDFVTVTLSVRDAVLELPELPDPLTKATMSNISTAPPTTHTHGSVYQVFVSDLDVVVVVAVIVLSWAHTRALLTVNTHNNKVCLSKRRLIKFFKV